MDRPSLSGQRLAKCFGSTEHETLALRGVSVDLEPGKLTLIMGPSGCGKSTLLAILSGLLRPTRGQVVFGDDDVYAQSAAARREFRRRHVGFIFQSYDLFPTLTVREQLEMVLLWGEQASAAEAAVRTEQMLGDLNLTRNAEEFPDMLSGGERQRAAIGRALIKKPDLIFADEPTSALDWDNGKQVMEILATVAHEQAATVLAVTHDPRLIPFADRILHLEDGTLKSDEGSVRNQPTVSRRPAWVAGENLVHP
jgi:putative ABC transport system ATP-binding protein